MKRIYLAIEHGEYFLFEAESIPQAKDVALMWGAQLLGEVPKKYKKLSYKQMLPHLI